MSNHLAVGNALLAVGEKVKATGVVYATERPGRPGRTAARIHPEACARCAEFRYVILGKMPRLHIPAILAVNPCRTALRTMSSRDMLLQHTRRRIVIHRSGILLRERMVCAFPGVAGCQRAALLEFAALLAVVLECGPAHVGQELLLGAECRHKTKEPRSL